ncbi:cytochrome b5-like heme/steroid binding domain-containing protein [Coemansia spiralis]|nr:cytochrome b5-like heme/steroid binding domain-containing protein [Coemansia spiralis]
MYNSPQMLSAPGNGQIRPRRKIALKPGHSPLDWERLMSSGEDLRGVSELQVFTMEEVAKHNKRHDCWIVICNRVYNVTRYLDFHPGGRGQLMRAAGKDGTRLFMETHSWVNADRTLRECIVGFIRP